MKHKRKYDRMEQIDILSHRYWIFMRHRRWSKAADVYARMRELMLKELKWENRTCRQ